MPESEESTAKSDHLQRLLSKIEDRKKKAELLAKEEEKRQKKVKRKPEPQDIKDEAAGNKQASESQTSKKAKKRDKKAKSKKGIVSDIDGKFTVIGDESLGPKKSKVG